MRLPDLKYDFYNLSEKEQMIVFSEFYDKREKMLLLPPPSYGRKKSSSSPKKGKMVTVSSAQLEVLKKLKLV